jgi:hypothetical protein
MILRAVVLTMSTKPLAQLSGIRQSAPHPHQVVMAMARLLPVLLMGKEPFLEQQVWQLISTQS